MIRDKKSAGNSYSAAGDDDINDVAAMGGVNLQEEANVSVLYFIQTRETGFHEYQEVKSMSCRNTSLNNSRDEIQLFISSSITSCFSFFPLACVFN